MALLLALPAMALSIELDVAGLDAPQQRRAHELVARTLDQLPDSLHSIDRVLPLRFTDDLPEGVVGHHRLGRLRLATALLKLPLPTSGIDPAQAALVHEIGHALDRGIGGWSGDPNFRRLVGWSGRSNDWVLRLPDQQVIQSPAESFAVHLEAFLLDASYACRQPALSGWFAAHVGETKRRTASCAQGVPFLVATGQGMGMALEAIDSDRVWAVDYLLAGTGDGMVSRFGHSMLRLVICAPGREPGPRCRMDLSHHRVLSYRAFVDDIQVSNWRGLTGGYASRLFVLPLDQVVDEYTRVELRDLRAYPLSLDRQQVDALVQAAAQSHWRYDGAYRFIDNNCAVETGRLLDVALMAQAGTALPPLASMTPKGVLRALHRQGWIGQAISEEKPDGLYFPSARAEYRQLLSLLQSAGQINASLSLDQWLSADAQRRGDIGREVTLEQAAAWLVLERAALRRSELRALSGLKRKLGRQTALDAAVADWRQWLAGLEAPGAMPIGGYGIPHSIERDQAERMVAQWQTEGQLHWTQLREGAEQSLGRNASAQLQISRERVREVGQRVRTLAAQ